LGGKNEYPSAVSHCRLLRLAYVLHAPQCGDRKDPRFSPKASSCWNHQVQHPYSQCHRRRSGQLNPSPLHHRGGPISIQVAVETTRCIPNTAIRDKGTLTLRIGMHCFFGRFFPLCPSALIIFSVPVRPGVHACSQRLLLPAFFSPVRFIYLHLPQALPFRAMIFLFAFTDFQCSLTRHFFLAESVLAD
jgi:hypothetical protein